MRYLFILLSLALVLPACSGAGLRMQQVPHNGYDSTIHYRFQAQVYSDDDGECQRLVVRVRPLNKVYWRTPPPDRLQLFDDDCMNPVRFERATFISPDTREPVQLFGPELNGFWSDQYRLQDELISWLWREGVL